jgi:uncharacterized protein YndB with AHSA1/START domain
VSSVVHDTFAIDRTYPATPERVFAAWATIEAKRQWFGDDAEVESIDEHTLDFRVGGGEHLVAKAGGSVYHFDSRYYDIVDNERLVWAYEMYVDGRRMSVSVGTVELTGVPGGTRLVMTEQGTYLDGLDTSEARAAGTEEFLGSLARYLERTA